MSEASDAYKEAQRLIADAKAKGATKLSLFTGKTQALTILPPEIGTLTALTWLDLSTTQITDLTPLTQLTALTSLDLRCPLITDLTPLFQLTALTSLDLSYTQVADLTPLTQLTSLSILDMSYTQVTDIAPFTQLTALNSLDLRGTRITNFAPLTQLTALVTLSLVRTQITDLAPLTQLTALTTLSLSNTQITDFAPLTQLTALTTLYLSNTQITDLAPLTQLTALNTLDLSFTQITNLAPLTQLTALTTLYLNQTQITDLRPLTQLTALTSLDLRDTQITDPRSLATLTKLATSPEHGGLAFTGTPFAAYPEFAGIAEIEDNAERAQRLFAALEGWVTEGRLSLTDHPAAPLPSVPPAHPAPVMAVIEEDRIDLARGLGLLEATDAASRARKGWASIKSFRDSFAGGFHLQNYAPLPAILASFDAALGDSYDTCNPVDLGVQGLRLMAQARNQALLDSLPVGADSDLKAFATAVELFVDRFPDWQAYKADAPSDQDDAQKVSDLRQDYLAIDDVIAQSPHVTPEYKAAFHAVVVNGTANDASEVDKRALMTSTVELVRLPSERIVEHARSGKPLRSFTSQMSKTGRAELPKVVYYGGGFVFDLLGRTAPALRHLAAAKPKRLSWLNAILDFMFDKDDPPNKP